MMVKQFELLNDVCALGEIYYRNCLLAVVFLCLLVAKIQTTEEKCDDDKATGTYSIYTDLSTCRQVYLDKTSKKRTDSIETDFSNDRCNAKNNLERETNVMYTTTNYKPIGNRGRKPF